MPALPSIALYEQRVTEAGLICQECQRQFVEPHGEPVTCRGCFRTLKKAEREHTRRAWFGIAGEKEDSARFAARARKLRTIKQARTERNG